MSWRKGRRKARKSRKKKRGITAQIMIDFVYKTELNRVWKAQRRRWRGYGEQCWIVEDNAKVHKAEKSVKCHRELGFRMLFHPPNSPDLNPIENVWAMLKKRLQNIENLSTNKDALWEVVQREWEAIPCPGGEGPFVTIWVVRRSGDSYMHMLRNLYK